MGEFNEMAQDKFWRTYWAGIEEDANAEIADPLTGPDGIRVNPNPAKVYEAFAIKGPHQVVRPRGVAEPTMSVTHRGVSLYWWSLALPVDATASRQRNLFLMVRQAYVSALEGVVMDEFPNPFVHAGIEWSGKEHQLGGLKADLLKHDLWRNTMPPEFLRKGGSATTEAKTEAARINAAKAREQASKNADERAAQIVKWHHGGMNDEDIAAELGISAESVPRTVARAKHRLSILQAR